MVTAPLTFGGRVFSPFTSVLTVGDGDAAFDTSAELATIIQANTGNAGFTKIFQKTVPAQQMMRWGSGSPLDQRGQGFATFAAVDLGTDFEDGMLRLVVANSRETRSVVVREFNTVRLHTATATSLITATPTDINEMMPLPEQIQSPLALEDSLLQIFFSTRSAGTTVDGVTFQIPVTTYQ